MLASGTHPNPSSPVPAGSRKVSAPRGSFSRAIEALITGLVDA
jgi:hypothetical protein